MDHLEKSLDGGTEAGGVMELLMQESGDSEPSCVVTLAAGDDMVTAADLVAGGGVTGGHDGGDVDDDGSGLGAPGAGLQYSLQEVAFEHDGIPAADMVQAITLPDGSTAYIQHSLKEGKLMEGQTFQFEDGTTAVIQDFTSGKSGKDSALPLATTKLVEGQAVQLEDGSTAFIQAPLKDSLQAVQLDDGTTAYFAGSLFSEASSLEGSAPHGSPGEAAAYALGESDISQEAVGQQQVMSAALGADEEGREGGRAMKTEPDPASSHQGGVVLMNTAARVVSEKALALGDKAYACIYEGCGRLYTTQHHLKVHERSHTGDRPFKCGCGKAFATGYGLKSHTRVHTGEKPYKCPEETCDKAFKTSGDLQKHVRTHTGERPFICPFEGCDRSFTTSNIRKVHIRTHTGERPYICTEEGCGKAFASATNYKNHIRIHTGEKPYVCTVHSCGKRFTEYSSLYKHHVVHTHTKPYVCSHCGKNYRQTSTLAMHKRTVHGDSAPDEHAQFVLAHPVAPPGGAAPPPPAVDAMMGVSGKSFRPAAGGHGGSQQGHVTDVDSGALVINTSSEPSAVVMVTNSGVNTTADHQMAVHGSVGVPVGSAALPCPLNVDGGVAFAQGGHIYLVTDHARLEAFHLSQSEQPPSSLMTSAVGHGDLDPDPAGGVAPAGAAIVMDTDMDTSGPGSEGVTSAENPVQQLIYL